VRDVSSKELGWAERIELMGLLFLHGMALAAWFVPMGTVLQASGLGEWTPYAFGASAIAALMSPLFFGAMADRSFPPVQVLRWVSIGAGCFSWLVAYGLGQGWSGWVILALVQMQSLLSVPTNSLTNSIVFSRLVHSHRQFGSIRAMGTAGWMAGCWLVSGMHLDASARTFQLSACLWMVVSCYTLLIPQGVVEGAVRGMTLRQRFGLDALSLLRDRNHRAIFLTMALVAVPFAAFYPYTPAHMKSLGMERTSAWMSLGQVIEVAVMFAVGGLMVQWKLKPVIMVGLMCGLARYLLYAMDASNPLLAGVMLHGLAYTFVYISTQIYLAQRVDAAWRTRAQALLSLMVGGVGNLIGYLVTGSWLYWCRGQAGEVDWRSFWLGLAVLVTVVIVYFAVGYRGEGLRRVDSHEARG